MLKCYAASKHMLTIRSKSPIEASRADLDSLTSINVGGS